MRNTARDRVGGWADPCLRHDGLAVGMTRARGPVRPGHRAGDPVLGRAEAARELLAGKWSVPVLRALDEQPLRYNRLFERLPGVSRRMLTATLQRLTVHGLVDRRKILPQHVDYSLTPAGEDLIDVVEALDRWAARVSAAAAPRAGSAERPAA
jgi:DNA-binding HxlR family transcriptional regulator